MTFPGIRASILCAAAFSANSIYSLGLPRFDYKVIPFIGMAHRAMRLGPPHRSHNICSCEGRTAHVLGPRDRLQVLRIDAAPNATEVVNVKTIWNRPDKMLIREPMSIGRAAFSRDVEGSVFARQGRSHPEPAAGKWAERNSVQKFFNKRFIISFGHVTTSLSRIGLACFAFIARLRAVFILTNLTASRHAVWTAH